MLTIKGSQKYFLMAPPKANHMLAFGTSANCTTIVFAIVKRVRIYSSLLPSAGNVDPKYLYRSHTVISSPPKLVLLGVICVNTISSVFDLLICSPYSTLCLASASPIFSSSIFIFAKNAMDVQGALLSHSFGNN